MAVIESRTSQSGATSWRVKIRIKGNPLVSATFKLRTDAKQWAVRTESEILEDRYFKHAKSKRLTLNDAITMYCAEGISHLKDPHTRITHLAYWEKRLGTAYLAELTSNRVLECRSELAEGKAHQIATNIKHGNETRAIREERSAKLVGSIKFHVVSRTLVSV